MLDIALIDISYNDPSLSVDQRIVLKRAIESTIERCTSNNINLVFIGGPEQFNLQLQNSIVLHNWDGIIIGSGVRSHIEHTAWYV